MSLITTATILKVSSVEIVKTLSSFIVGHSEETQPDPNTFGINLPPPITIESTAKPCSQAKPLKPSMIKPLRLFIFYIEGEYVSLNVVFIMIDFVLWKYLSSLEKSNNSEGKKKIKDNNIIALNII